MVRPFARHYDSIYGDKDYEADMRVLRTLVGSSPSGYSKILEVGAGTGNHTLRLAKLAEKLVSLEIDQDFLQAAEAKMVSHSNVTLLPTPVENLVEADFEGVAAFFNVLNYVPHGQLEGFVAAIGRRLPSQGWFVGDLWNGDAVIADPPKPETRVKEGLAILVRQKIDPVLDPMAREVTLNYDILIEGRDFNDHFRESLLMYLPGLRRLAKVFRSAGFNEPVFYERRQFPRPASPASWQVWLHATKI